MKGRTANIAILVVCWLLVAGFGSYLTFMKQPLELERLQEAERVVALKQDEAGALRLQTTSAEQTSREVLSRWNARYKVMPETLQAHNVVAYFNTLTRDGFKNVDVEVQGTAPGADYNTISLKVSGRGLYRSLYDFVWALENNRSFYRIKSLNLDHLDLITNEKTASGQDRNRLDVLVSFTMDVEALYGGTLGVSANAASVVASDGGPAAPRLNPNAPPGVPASVLPTRRPPRNPFYPLILSEIPPNTYGLMDIETAALISIADGRAIFTDGEGYHTLGTGSEVYLGEIVSVNPQTGVVRARLNKGGIIDEVERRIGGDDYSRGARGDDAPTGDQYRPVNPDGSAAATAAPTPQGRPRQINPVTGN